MHVGVYVLRTCCVRAAHGMLAVRCVPDKMSVVNLPVAPVYVIRIVGVNTHAHTHRSVYTQTLTHTRTCVHTHAHTHTRARAPRIHVYLMQFDNIIW